MSTPDSTDSMALWQALLYGVQWPATQGVALNLGYQFPENAGDWSGYVGLGHLGAGFVPWTSPEAQAAALGAMSAWSDVSAISFLPAAIGDGAAGLRFGFTRWEMDSQQLGYAYLPSAGDRAGDIWLNSGLLDADRTWLLPGGVGYFALLHEIGHTLGLKHSDEASPYNDLTVPLLSDSVFLTVMSDQVWPGVPLGAPAAIDRWPTTPMSLDIAAIRSLYGDQLVVHAGDDVHRFEGEGHYLQMLVDSGGLDCLLLEGDAPGLIDLKPGAWNALGVPIAILGGLIRNPMTVQIDAGTWIENARGGSGDDEISGNVLNNRLEGGAGNDRLHGGGGTNELIGGDGADIFVLEPDSTEILLDFDPESGDRVDLAALLSGLSASNLSPFVTGHLSVRDGNSGAELLFDADGREAEFAPGVVAVFAGLDADDLKPVHALQDLHLNEPAALTGFTILGTAGNDVLNGGPNDDTIFGYGGDDFLYGEAGNDVLNPGSGNNVLYGGAGTDTAYYSDAISGHSIVTEGKRIRVSSYLAAQTDYLYEIEVLRFSDQTVNLPAYVPIQGGSGNDTLGGTPGEDDIYGLAGNDTLQGFGGNDFLDGGVGNDTLIGGTGDDVYVVDALGDVVTELPGEGVADRVVANVNFVTLADNVEILQLGSGVERGSGNSLSNTLIGNSGSNWLDGGGGADRMEGGSGSDTYFVDNADDSIVETAISPAGGDGSQPLDGPEVDKVIAAISFTLGSLLEKLELTSAAGNASGTGNEGPNELTGNDLNNLLAGLGDNDEINGAGGVDFALFLGGSQAGYRFSGGSAGQVMVTDVVTTDGNDGVDILTNIEYASFTDGNIALLTANNFSLTGDAANNSLRWIGNQSVVLDGADGVDVFQGGGGNDTIRGGGGVDTLILSGQRADYSVSSVGNVIAFSSYAEGSDTIYDVEFFQFADRVLSATQVLDAAPPSISRLDPSDEYVGIAVGADFVLTFNETISRGAGTVQLLKLDGVSVATYDAATSTNLTVSGSQLVVNPGADLSPGTSYRLVLTAGCVQDVAGNAFAGLESYNFTTASSAVYGTEGANVLSGTAAADSIFGLGGDDQLTGNGANDLLDGGAGIDTAVYSGLRKNYPLGNAGLNRTVSDIVGNEGTDTLVAVERLKFADGHLALDLSGHAGQVAKILGAVFGRTVVANEEYVKIGLSYLDAGMPYRDLIDLALAVKQVSIPADVVNLLWTNVVGSLPSPAQAQPYIDMMNAGTSRAQLGELAAETNENQVNINLSGLAVTGLPYWL